MAYRRYFKQAKSKRGPKKVKPMIGVWLQKIGTKAKRHVAANSGVSNTSAGDVIIIDL